MSIYRRRLGINCQLGTFLGWKSMKLSSQLPWDVICCEVRIFGPIKVFSIYTEFPLGELGPIEQFLKINWKKCKPSSEYSLSFKVRVVSFVIEEKHAFNKSGVILVAERSREVKLGRKSNNLARSFPFSFFVILLPAKHKDSIDVLGSSILGSEEEMWYLSSKKSQIRTWVSEIHRFKRLALLQ